MTHRGGSAAPHRRGNTYLALRVHSGKPFFFYCHLLAAGQNNFVSQLLRTVILLHVLIFIVLYLFSENGHFGAQTFTISKEETWLGLKGTTSRLAFLNNSRSRCPSSPTSLSILTLIFQGFAAQTSMLFLTSSSQ